MSQTFGDEGQLTHWEGPDGTDVEYQYDSAGRRTAVVVDGKRISYAFDGQGRVVEISDDSGIIATQAYDIRGNLSTTEFSNGTVEQRQYDGRSRLIQLTVRDGDQVIRRYDYEYDLGGRLTEETDETGRSRSYGYDASGQLIRYTLRDAAGASEDDYRYRYDAVGNMVQVVDNGVETQLTYGALGRLQPRLTTDGLIDYEYDDQGNLLRGFTTEGDLFNYSWDSSGRLISATTHEEGVSATVEYAYDWTGLLIRRTEDGVTTEYIYDRSGELPRVIRAIRDGVAEDYVHSDRILSRSSSGAQHFYHADASGNVRFQTDASAAVGSALDYLPFGRLSPDSVDASAEGLLAYQFAGEPLDPTTQLTYLRQRHYSSSLRRFVSPDAYQGHEIIPLSQQPYQYGMNSPLMYGDPSGEWAAPTLAEVQVALSIAATITVVSTIQVVAGMGGLSGQEVRFQGPMVGFGAGVNAGVGFGVDFYTGLLASDVSFVGGPTSAEGYRLSAGAGATFGLGVGLSAAFGPTAGAVDVGLNLNPVTRFLGGTALTGAMVLADASVQGGVGQTFASYLALGFAKGNASGGSAGIAVGAGLNYKTGVYVAASAAINQSDARYIQGLGQSIDAVGLTHMIDYLTARYF